LPLRRGRFAVMSQTGITMGASGTINGDVMSYPTKALTGFVETMNDGKTYYTSDAVDGYIYATGISNPEYLTEATAEVKDAYDYALTLPTDTFDAAAVDLIGKTYKAGVYKWTGAISLTGTVTFDGSDTDVFIMITAAAFSPAANSKVVFTGGAKAENLFWVLGAALTAGANSDLHGVVLCAAAMTVGANARWTGALLTWGITGPGVGAVTIGANAEINGASCGPICLGEVGDDSSGTDGKTQIITTTTEAIPPIVEIVSQDTSTVTVRLNQEWTTSSDSETLAIFYEYKEDIWTNKCHVADGVRGSSKVDEFTVTCNVLSPYAHLHICVADNKAAENGKDILSPTGDDATIPRCCNAEDIVPENTATVCYSLEILCEPKCIDTTSESRKLRRLRGSE